MPESRLQTVLNLAETRESSAAVNYAEARKTFDQNLSKLKELQTFRDDYDCGSSRSQAIGDFQSTRVFLSQLSEVIDQQEMNLRQARDHMNDRQGDWSDFRVKRKSLEKLVEKQARAGLLKQGRAEQQELDEISCHRGS